MLLGAGALGVQQLRSGAGSTPDDVSRTARGDAPALAPRPAPEGPPAEAPPPGPTPPGEAAQAVPPATGPMGPGPEGGQAAPGPEPDLTGVRPAVRRSPYGIAKRPAGPLGRRGWGGPTGHWARYGSFPLPRGTATLAVTVLDANAIPVAGADVFLGHPDLAGEEAISFADLRKTGRTDGAGRLMAEQLPAGGAAVFANWNNRLNGPGGLDGRRAVRVRLSPGAAIAVTVVLPLEVGRLGRVRGTILDPTGTPLAAAAVTVGYLQHWTKADGAFAFEGVPLGEATLFVRRTGYVSASVSLDVPANTPVVREVALDYAESGPARLEGRVVGPEGEPVPGARVYLMFTADQGTARSALADAQGRFVLKSLPDRVRTESIRLQAGRLPTYTGTVQVFADGLPDERITLTLPSRNVEVELRVLDAGTEEPVRMVSAQVEHPDGSRPHATLALDRATGYRQGVAEPGAHLLVIDALDHEGLRAEIDIQPDAVGRFVHTVRLARRTPESAEVHLTVRVTDAATGAPLDTVTIEVRDPETGEAIAKFTGRREGGTFLMPAPSGLRRIVVTAEGHEASSQDVPLPADPGEVELAVALRPH